MGFADTVMLIVGLEFTVTTVFVIPVQPLISVLVTVYVVVIKGFAVTMAPVVVDKPVGGDHE